jgi:hypothetical protein
MTTRALRSSVKASDETRHALIGLFHEWFEDAGETAEEDRCE